MASAVRMMSVNVAFARRTLVANGCCSELVITVLLWFHRSYFGSLLSRTRCLWILCVARGIEGVVACGLGPLQRNLSGGYFWLTSGLAVGLAAWGNGIALGTTSFGGAGRVIDRIGEALPRSMLSR